MPRWTAPDGVALAYDVRGDGRPVLLLHGFGSSTHINWERPGVVAALVEAGHRVVTYDGRGHGSSDAPHDVAAYAGATLVTDAMGLLDALEMPDADLVGYSMGALVAVRIAAGHPADGRIAAGHPADGRIAAGHPADGRIAAGHPDDRRVVLGGVGWKLLGARSLGTPGSAEAIAAALEAEDPATVVSGSARAFRSFADATGADRLALAALQRAQPFAEPVRLEEVRVPVLVVVGDRDTLAGDPEPLAASIPGARAATVPGDHLSAVVAPEFRAAVVDFLRR